MVSSGIEHGFVDVVCGGAVTAGAGLDKPAVNGDVN
jgi:hypothetical protein